MVKWNWEWCLLIGESGSWTHRALKIQTFASDWMLPAVSDKEKKPLLCLLWWAHHCQVSIVFVFLIFNVLAGHFYYPHLMGKGIGARRFRNLPKVTQPISGRVARQARPVCPQSLWIYSACCDLTTHHRLPSAYTHRKHLRELEIFCNDCSVYTNLFQILQIFEEELFHFSLMLKGSLFYNSTNISI